MSQEHSAALCPPEASRSLLAACCSAHLQNPGAGSTRIHNRRNFRQNELNCKENICYLCSLQAFVILSTSSQPCSWNISEPGSETVQPADFLHSIWSRFSNSRMLAKFYQLLDFLWASNLASLPAFVHFCPYKIQEPIPWISNFENKNIKNIWQTRFHQFHQKNATDCETKAETDALVHVCFGRSMKFNLLRKPSWKVSWFGTLSCAFGAWLLGIFFCSKSTLWQRLGLQKLKSEALSRLQFYDPQHAVSSFPSPPEASRSLLAACCSAHLQNPGTNSKRIHNRQNFRQNELNCKENICCHCSLQAFVILSTSSQPCSWNILEGPAKYRLQPAALQSLGKHVFG